MAAKTVQGENGLRKRRMCRAYWSVAKVNVDIGVLDRNDDRPPDGSDPVKGPRRSPTGDAIVFNGRFRAEFLNAH